MKKLKYYILLASLALIATKCPDKNPPTPVDPCSNANISSAEFEVWERNNTGRSEDNLKIVTDTLVIRGNYTLFFKDSACTKRIRIEMDNSIFDENDIFTSFDGQTRKKAFQFSANSNSNDLFKINITVFGENLPNTCNTRVESKTFQVINYWQSPRTFGRFKVAYSSNPLDSFFIFTSVNDENLNDKKFMIYNFMQGIYVSCDFYDDRINYNYFETGITDDLNAWSVLNNIFLCTTNTGNYCYSSSVNVNFDSYDFEKIKVSNKHISIEFSAWINITKTNKTLSGIKF